MISRIRLLIVSLLVISCFFGCIEPTEGEFDFRGDILFIDAYALTEPGLSTVTISNSIYQYDSYTVRPVKNAAVRLENVNTGGSVVFMEDSLGVYRSPLDFAAGEGEVWKLYIQLEDGRRFESQAETVTAAIPIDEVKVEYSDEVKFDAVFGKFIPGHRISIDWKDPAGEENYYLWKYRSFEPLSVCKTCQRGILRNGVCQTITNNFFTPYFDYLCTPRCWQIRYGDELLIFEDRLADGTEIKDREIAIIPYYRRPDILIEVQQLSLNKSAYEYFEIINEQVAEGGGLNAPPPAALLGNLFNPDNSSEVVLGQFTAAGVLTENIYIDRSSITIPPVTPDLPIVLESCATCPTQHPCEEGLFRTAVKPDGWP